MLSFANLFSLSSNSRLKQRAMAQDHLLQLIDTSLSFDTHSFLRDVCFVALLSSNPEKVLNRFKVQSLTQCKERTRHGSTAPQHEFILVELTDTQPAEPEVTQPFLMFLERTASADRSSPSQFTAHPDSANVLKTIVQALKELSPATIQALREKVTSPLPHSLDSHPYYEATLDEPQLEPLPFLDGASLAAGKLLQISTKSIPSKGHRQAEDRFIGGQNIAHYFHASHNIRQLRPEAMSLFDLAVLADVVHDHDPLYSLFQHQCFWFASLVCEVVESVYVCRKVGGATGRKSISDICIPPNDYLPDLAGRWAGILINKVEEAVSSAVALNFRKCLQEKREEVSIFYF